MTLDSRPSLSLALIVSRSSAAHVARLLSCDESAVRAWARGRRRPSSDWRARLVAFDPSLLESGWGAPAASDGEEAAPVSPAESAPVALPAPAAARVARLEQRAGRPSPGEDRLEEIISECDELLAAAAEPGSHASIRDRSTLMATKASAAIRLSKLRGEDAISMRKLLDSRWWKEIEETTYRVLCEMRQPDVCKRLAEELGRLEREHCGQGGEE